MSGNCAGQHCCLLQGACQAAHPSCAAVIITALLITLCKWAERGGGRGGSRITEEERVILLGGYDFAPLIKIPGILNCFLSKGLKGRIFLLMKINEEKWISHFQGIQWRSPCSLAAELI